MFEHPGAQEWCMWLTNITWNKDIVTADALHNITFVCPFKNSTDIEGIEKSLENPATFFVQVVRLILCLILLIILVVLYNSVTVLGRTVLSVALCSLYWIIMFLLIALKALVIVVMVPSVTDGKSPQAQSDINQAGFVCTILAQVIADYMMFLALDHEQKFRSSDYATIDESPYSSNSCLPVTWRKVACSWYRLVVTMVTLIPLAMLGAVEIIFEISEHASPHVPPRAPPALIWIFILSLYIPRFCSLILVIKMFLLKDSLRPSVLAKVYLVLAFILSIAEDLPSSVTTVAPYAHDSPSPYDCPNPCELDVLTVFDLFQLLGATSLIFYTLFIRSQYLRVEPECKLAMVWDIQRAMNVNGREDIIAN